MGPWWLFTHLLYSPPTVQNRSRWHRVTYHNSVIPDSFSTGMCPHHGLKVLNDMTV